MIRLKNIGIPQSALSNYQSVIDLSNIVEKSLIISALTEIFVFVIWSKGGIGTTAQTMVVLFFLTALLFFINKKGYPKEAGTGLFSITSLSVTYLAYQGDGIYNIPFIFFPIILIFSGLFFGRVLIPHITFFLIALTTILFLLDRNGTIIPFDGVVQWAPDYYAISVVILATTGAMLSVVMKTVEANIEQISLSEQLIKESYELTLEGWAKALELSGREPKGHSQRVTTLVTEFADALGLSEDAKASLRQGALLHDIGKMGIPDSIIHKPGPLTEDEIEFSKAHTLFAKKILQDIAYFQSLMDIPVYHHEQWDGKGYPEGLSAEKIPYAARIFAVIDSWDSLTSNQIYRAAWSETRALSYIQEEAGKKFDKKIVDAFLNFLKQDMERTHGS